MPNLNGLSFSSLAVMPPVVALASPAINAAYTVPADIAVSAAGTDNLNTITKVQFYNGASLLGEDWTSPHGITWSNAPPGGHTLTARAFYAGGTVDSTPVSITVVNPPIIAVISLPGATLTLSWSGGIPPYQVQQVTNLGVADWQNVGGPSNTNRLILSSGGKSAFYRIVGP